MTEVNDMIILSYCNAKNVQIFMTHYICSPLLLSEGKIVVNEFGNAIKSKCGWSGVLWHTVKTCVSEH